MLPQVWMGDTDKPLRPDDMAPPQRDYGKSMRWKKPEGGLWTSTATPLGPYVSDWHRWCSEEQWGLAPAWWLGWPHTDLRLFVIDSLADLCAAIDKYPNPDADRFFLHYPDWMAIAGEYDGVHLTYRGQAETHLSTPDLYGWDCESTVWFRWPFDRIEGPFPAP